MHKKIPDTLLKLVSLLNDCNFHDGDSLGKVLKITRSAVWKAIQKLSHYGIQIESMKGTGYIIREPLILLDENFIKQGLINQNIEIEIFESIDSTNSYIKTITQKQIRVCITEHQLSGRGRFDRKWVSPFGKNIYLSCLYLFEKDISELSGLSIVVGLSIIRSLKSLNLLDELKLKWPNDILYDDKKLGGNLIEIRAESNGLAYVTIGIGVNVNMLSNNDINQDWTSLRKILDKQINRNELIVLLLNNLMRNLEIFNQEGLLPFMSEWSKYDVLENNEILVTSSDNLVKGYARGINNQGNLLLELDNGSIKVFSSGDTSIKKEKTLT